MIKKMSPQLLVSNLDRSVAFFTQQLDFEIDFRYEDFYVGIIKNSHSIHLKLTDQLTTNGQRKDHGKGPEDLDIQFSIDDIETLYADLANKPITITQPLRTMPYGKEFYIADPDGHILGFVEES